MLQEIEMFPKRWLFFKNSCFLKIPYNIYFVIFNSEMLVKLAYFV